VFLHCPAEETLGCPNIAPSLDKQSIVRLSLSPLDIDRSNDSMKSSIELDRPVMERSTRHARWEDIDLPSNLPGLQEGV
jgi:hypothetical protein